MPLYLKQKPSQRQTWADHNYLNQHTLDEVVNITEQLDSLIEWMGIPMSSLSDASITTKDFYPEQYRRIGQAIAAGLIQNLAVKTSEREYTSLTGIKMRIHPASVYADRYPPIIIFTEILSINDQTFAVNCQAVEETWVLQIAPQLLTTIKEPLMHPWKGNQVGEYTIELLGGLEIRRKYKGGKLPQHMMDQSDRQHHHKHDRNRKERRHPKSNKFKNTPKKYHG